MNEVNSGNVRRRKNKRSGITIMAFIFFSTFLGALAISFLTIQLNMISSDYNRLMEVDYADLSFMQDIDTLLYKHEAIVFQHMSTDENDEKSKLQLEANSVEEELNGILVDFGNNIKGREFESYYHTIYSGIVGYFKNIELIFNLSVKGDVNTARYHMNSSIKNYIESVNESTDKLSVITKKNMDIKRDSMATNIRITKTAIFLLLIAIIIFGITAYIKCGKLTSAIVNMDALTEIPNADKCEEYMLKLYKKKKLENYTSILLNIKDFNYTNRLYGSEIGDSLLNAYAKYLQDQLEKDELVSRQAGDSFMILIKQERAKEFLEEISMIQLRIMVDGGLKDFKINSRCGIYPVQSEDTVSDVMNCVSMTLNKAKQTGENDHVWFSKEQYEQIIEEKNILEQFKAGLKNKEFVVYYQPKVDAKTNQLCGAEALVRWIRDGKLVPPGTFIPVLEKEGKVVELDFYVFERVCEDISAWLEQGIEPVRISSNFSKLHMKNKHLADYILDIIKKYQVNPKYIEVELTESSGYENLKALKSFVKQMRKSRIHTSMDDFGTGYSSLSMLKDVDVDVVKLDKSFLNGVDQGDKVKEKMISHLVHMIQDLERTVVCEGVETTKELEFLKSVSCDMIQGYLFDKPLPHNDFESRLVKPKYS